MRPLVLDVSRLLTGLRFAGPTGVETLELGLARHLPPGPGLALTPWGARKVAPATLARIADTAARRWREDESDVTGQLAGVAAFLAGREVPRPAPRPDASLLSAMRFAPSLLGRVTSLPTDSVTLHTGFFRLEQPALFDWKAKRRDIGMIVAFHDILPLTHPDWFRPGEAALHRARLVTALKLADAITVPAKAVRDDVAEFALEVGLKLPPLHVVNLPVAARFATATPMAADLPYMVIAGTIEPRKNHALLLEVWNRLGPDAPKLIIAGRRGWANDAVFSALDAKPANIMEAPGLSSGTLARLIKGAAALLSPSLDEGFGLPVAEALSAGTPVIAADTPVYRELWGSRTVLVGPQDVDAWVEAVRVPPPRGAGFVRTDWPTYVSALRAITGSV